MDSSSLVDVEIRQGERLVSALDEKKIPVTTAGWFRDSEDDSWRLYLAMPMVEKVGTGPAYEKVQTILRETLDLDIQLLRRIVIVSNMDPFVRNLLKRGIRTRGKNIQPKRFQPGVINNRLIGDALIYRSS